VPQNNSEVTMSIHEIHSITFYFFLSKREHKEKEGSFVMIFELKGLRLVYV
jgi:hypothetical protein